MINIINLFAKIILSVFLSIQLNFLLVTGVSAKANVEQLPTIILSGFLDENDKSVKFDKVIEKNQFYLSDKDENKYNLSANVSFKTLIKKIPFKQLPFNIEDNSNIDSEPTRLLFSENNSSKSGKIEVDFIPNFQEIQSSNYDELASTYDEFSIEYEDIYADNPSIVNFSLLLESEVDSDGKQEKIHYKINSSKELHNTNLLNEKYSELHNTNLLNEKYSELHNINPSNEVWIPKNNTYIFKRFFGLKDSNKWRYKQDEDRVVIQRRFDRTLPEFKAMELVFDAGTKLSWINLRIEKKDGGEVILDWESIPKQISKMDDDSLRVKLFLSEYQKQYKQIFLKELIVFIDGTSNEIVSKKPLKSLVWLNLVKNNTVALSDIHEDEHLNQGLKNYKIINKEQEIDISSIQIEEIGDGRKIIRADLNELISQINLNSKVVSVKLFLEPLFKNRPGGSEITKLLFSSYYEKEFPAFALQGEDYLKRSGVIFDVLNKEKKDSYLWPLMYEFSHSPQEFFSIASTNLTKDPLGNWIDYDWKIGKEISKNSYLYIGGEDNQDEVIGIKATPYSFTGEKLGSWFLNINSSLLLNELRGNHYQIDYINIRVYLDQDSSKNDTNDKGPLDIVQENKLLNELALYKIGNLSINEILDAATFKLQKTPINFELEQESLPSNILVNKNPDGEIEFVFTDNFLKDDLFFTTPIINKLQSLDFSYKVPWFFPAIDQCWLELTFEKNGKEIQKKICLDGFSGTKNILFEESVKQIKWRIVFPNNYNNLSSLDRAKLSFSIQQNFRPFVREQLTNHPILALDNNRISSNVFEYKKDGSKLYFDTNEIRNKSYFNRLIYLEHPWLVLNKIILEREEPFNTEEWKNLNKEEMIGAEVSVWLKSLGFLVIFFGVWYLFNSGWIAKSFQVFLSLFLSIWGFPVRVLKWFNLEVSWRLSFLWWSIVAISLYLCGILFSSANLQENYYFTFAGMAIVFCWKAFVESSSSLLSKKIYKRAGTVYFSGFAFSLIGVAVLLILKLDHIAEHLALISFYMLLVGVFLELSGLGKNKSSSNIDSSI